MRITIRMTEENSGMGNADKSLWRSSSFTMKRCSLRTRADRKALIAFAVAYTVQCSYCIDT